MLRVYLLIPLWMAALAAAFTVGGPHPPQVPYVRECPQAHGSKEDSLQLALDLLTQRTDLIPEYNDCQRFIVDQRFDSLYAIYATHPRTVLVSSNVGVLVAVIRSFDGTYGPLGIVPGLSCVYLSGDRRRAKVVSASDSTADKCCPLADFERLGGTLLEARAQTIREFAADSNYPQVARWDWDARQGLHYFGVKCEVAWCEIGPRGFQSSLAWTPDPSLPYRMRRNIAIKAWYDEQLVAGATPAGGGLPVMTGVRGTIFPAESLANYDDASWHGRWRVVAYVALAHPIEKYLTTMNLAGTRANPGTPLKTDSLNRIEICVGSSNDCMIRPADIASCPTVTSDTSNATWGWSRVVRAGTAIVKYRCLRRWTNAGIAAYLPATSRWRWVRDDETSWTKCSAGCCEVH